MVCGANGVNVVAVDVPAVKVYPGCRYVFSWAEWPEGRRPRGCPPEL